MKDGIKNPMDFRQASGYVSQVLR